MTTAASTTATPSIPRDVRIDYLFLAGVVAKSFDPLKEKIKERFQDRLGEDLTSFHITGDLADGILIRSEPAKINPKKFYELFKKGEINEKEFLACLNVHKEEATKVVHPKILAEISDIGDVQVSLRVTGKKDVKVDPRSAATKLMVAIDEAEKDAAEKPLPTEAEASKVKKTGKK